MTIPDSMARGASTGECPPPRLFRKTATPLLEPVQPYPTGINHTSKEMANDMDRVKVWDKAHRRRSWPYAPDGSSGVSEGSFCDTKPAGYLVNLRSNPIAEHLTPTGVDHCNELVDYAAIADLNVDEWAQSFIDSLNPPDVEQSVGLNLQEMQPARGIPTQEAQRRVPDGRGRNRDNLKDVRPSAWNPNLVGDHGQLKILPRPAQGWVGGYNTGQTTSNSQSFALPRASNAGFPALQARESFQSAQAPTAPLWQAPPVPNVELSHHLRNLPVQTNQYTEPPREEVVSKPTTPKSPHKIQKSRPRKPIEYRGGRPVPPSVKDDRWNIWTVGNMDIRHPYGGVTVKHLVQVLYALDENQRTKHSWKSLKKQVLDKRERADGKLREQMPKGWMPHQGWWVHLM